MQKDMAWLLVCLVASAMLVFIAPSSHVERYRSTSSQGQPVHRVYERDAGRREFVDAWREPWRSFERERYQQRWVVP